MSIDPKLKSALNSVLSQDVEIPNQKIVPVDRVEEPIKTKQYNIVMPEWEWRALKQISLDSGKRIKDLINEAVIIQYNIKENK